MGIIRANNARVGELLVTRSKLTVEQGWLNLARPDAELDPANYVDYVPYLRTLTVDYIKPSDGSVVSSWTGTAAGSVVTLDANQSSVTGLGQVLADSLYEDAAYHDGYEGDMSAFSYSTAVSAAERYVVVISGVEYQITDVDPSTLEITLSAAPAAGALSFVIYPHRSPSSPTFARHRSVDGVAIMSGGIDQLSALRVRNRMQGHRHRHVYGNASGGSGLVGGNTPGGTATGWVEDPIPDLSGVVPRTGRTSRPDSAIYHFYEYIGRYTP